MLKAISKFLEYIYKRREKPKETEHDKSFEEIKDQSTKRTWIEKTFKF